MWVDAVNSFFGALDDFCDVWRRGVESQGVGVCDILFEACEEGRFVVKGGVIRGVFSL